jgi:predicted DNA-binding transcriptional regulator AlpA
MEEKTESFLLGRKRTAAALDVSTRTIDNLVVSGQLVPVKIGKRVMFRRSEIERFVQKSHSTKRGTNYKTGESASRGPKWS